MNAIFDAHEFNEAAPEEYPHWDHVDSIKLSNLVEQIIGKIFEEMRLHGSYRIATPGLRWALIAIARTTPNPILVPAVSS